ncbi:DUF3807 domain-containing protein [Aspergillus affinis]|uniref:DUF3807 domain-containing protein n=1 Tax=Aspergillus affinis TaxID=1070780 RepID=UPI0022FE7200|nr:uncharacterized protein KD926_011754 [Aspergillus affinis]KAI9044783.1 hypothetical protein KD926_011754 [Aspergillus affinis]
MPDLQIPNVTIEDLQTFQAQHFPGSAQIPTTQYQYRHDETVDEHLDGGNAYDEDDLGYYPDGVKRTLTDEQIKIFRHSEIHTLLREKQLREEALLEEAREKAEVEEEAIKSRKEAIPETVDKEPTNHPKRAEGEVEDSVLDYGEDASVGNVRKPARPGYASQFTGRRIISYDD